MWGPFPGWGEGGDPAPPLGKPAASRTPLRLVIPPDPAGRTPSHDYGPPGIPRLRHRRQWPLLKRTEPTAVPRHPSSSLSVISKKGGLAHLPSGDFQRQRRLARLRRGLSCCGQCGR